MHDVKVIPNEECVNQHKLLVCDARIVKSEDRCQKFVPKRPGWKLQQADLSDKFYETFTGEIKYTSGEQVDNIWPRLKQGLLSATEKTCGWTKKGIWIIQIVNNCKSKINILMQKGKHGMPSIQLKELRKKRRLPVLKTKKSSFVSPNKCVQKIRM